MAITEETRHHLYQRLEEVLGREEAATMMEHLPPVGWADLATKRDLEHLESVMEARFTAVDARFTSVDTRFTAIETRLTAVEGRITGLEAKMEQGFRRQTTTLVFGMLGAMAACSGVLVTALHGAHG